MIISKINYYLHVYIILFENIVCSIMFCSCFACSHILYMPNISTGNSWLEATTRMLLCFLLDCNSLTFVLPGKIFM